MASDKQLFQGQTSHPLSEEEIEAFYDKFSIRSYDSFMRRLFSGADERRDVRDFFRDSLDEMLKTPTGREQARAIIASEQTYRIFGCNDANISLNGYTRQNSDEIFVNLTAVGGNQTNVVGSTILHECLHLRQQATEYNSKILLDAETQGLSQQLLFETNSRKNPSYCQSFEFNRQKWLNIARTGKYPRNFTGLRFEPMPNLSRAELNEAYEAYAHQMASLETRAQATQDFAKPAAEWGKNPSLKYPSYKLASVRELYNKQDDAYLQAGIEATVPKSVAEDIASRNPFINPSDFYALYQEKSAEAAAQRSLINIDDFIKNSDDSTGNALGSDLIKDIIAREKDPEFRNRAQQFLTNMMKGLPVSEEDKIVFHHTLYMNIQDGEMGITLKERRAKLYGLIHMSQTENPNKNPLRTKMINRTAEAIGEKKLPIVQNDAHQQEQQGGLLNTLRSNGTAYQETSDMPISRGGREGMA